MIRHRPVARTVAYSFVFPALLAGMMAAPAIPAHASSNPSKRGTIFVNGQPHVVRRAKPREITQHEHFQIARTLGTTPLVKRKHYAELAKSLPPDCPILCATNRALASVTGTERPIAAHALQLALYLAMSKSIVSGPEIKQLFDWGRLTRQNAVKELKPFLKRVEANIDGPGSPDKNPRYQLEHQALAPLERIAKFAFVAGTANPELASQLDPNPLRTLRTTIVHQAVAWWKGRTTGLRNAGTAAWSNSTTWLGSAVDRLRRPLTTPSESNTQVAISSRLPSVKAQMPPTENGDAKPQRPKIMKKTRGRHRVEASEASPLPDFAELASASPPARILVHPEFLDSSLAPIRVVNMVKQLAQIPRAKIQAALLRKSKPTATANRKIKDAVWKSPEKDLWVGKLASGEIRLLVIVTYDKAPDAQPDPEARPRKIVICRGAHGDAHDRSFLDAADQLGELVEEGGADSYLANDKIVDLAQPLEKRHNGKVKRLQNAAKDLLAQDRLSRLASSIAKQAETLRGELFERVPSDETLALVNGRLASVLRAAANGESVAGAEGNPQTRGDVLRAIPDLLRAHEGSATRATEAIAVGLPESEIRAVHEMLDGWNRLSATVSALTPRERDGDVLKQSDELFGKLGLAKDETPRNTLRSERSALSNITGD